MARSQSAGSLVLPNLLPVFTPALSPMGLPAWSRWTSQAAHTGTVAGSKLVGCLACHLSACHLAVYYVAVCYLAVRRLDNSELAGCHLVATVSFCVSPASLWDCCLSLDNLPPAYFCLSVCYLSFGCLSD